MADIKENVKKIRQAIYGKDVRESIAAGIEAINNQQDEYETNVTNRQDEYENNITAQWSSYKKELDNTESKRAVNEEIRKHDEEIRKKNENTRITTFNKNEESRNTKFNTNEAERQQNEEVRQQAENNRLIAENSRTKEFNEMKDTFKEAAKTNVELEISQARKDTNNISHNNLKERIDADVKKVKSQMSDIMQQQQENFTSVSNGKSLLETTITDKGGIVSKEHDVATFQELNNGVNSIKVGDYSIGNLIPINNLQEHYTVRVTNTLNVKTIAPSEPSLSMVCSDTNNNIVLYNQEEKKLSLVDKFGKLIKKISIESFCGVSDYKDLSMVYADNFKKIYIVWLTNSYARYFIELPINLSSMTKVRLDYNGWPSSGYPCKDTYGNMYMYIYNTIYKFSPSGKRVSDSSYKTVRGMTQHNGSIFVAGNFGVYKYTLDLHATKLNSKDAYRNLKSIGDDLFAVRYVNNRIVKLDQYGSEIWSVAGLDFDGVSSNDNLIVIYGTETNIYNRKNLTNTSIKTEKTTTLNAIVATPDSNLWYGKSSSNNINKCSYYNDVLTHYKILK